MVIQDFKYNVFRKAFTFSFRMTSSPILLCAMLLNWGTSGSYLLMRSRNYTTNFRNISASLLKAVLIQFGEWEVVFDHKRELILFCYIQQQRAEAHRVLKSIWYRNEKGHQIYFNKQDKYRWNFQLKSILIKDFFN